MTEPNHERVGTAGRILDSAERLVQQRGFNGFSYADVAAELGVTKASLHYHFAGKAELGEALIVRYAARFADALQRSTRAPTALPRSSRRTPTSLRRCRPRSPDVPLRHARGGGGNAPGAVRRAVVAFFDASEAWLERVLDEGRVDATLEFSGTARETARMLVGALEGAMLVARPYDDVERFDESANRLLAGLRVAS